MKPSRRDVLKALLAAPAATFAFTDAEAAQAAAAAQTARAAAKPFAPKFFTASEYRLVRTLADIVIPKDERSGSATDAGVPEFSQGVAIFNNFRDLTAAGFWTTRMGIDDLQYMGNRSVARWNGCPEAALKKLGVSYE